jgi:hypothetical protein
LVAIDVSARSGQKKLEDRFSEKRVYHQTFYILHRAPATTLPGLTHVGRVAPLTRESIVKRAMIAEEMFHATGLGPATGLTIRRLAELAPTRLALMHGSSFEGNGAEQLNHLADRYETLLETASQH